MPVTMEQVINQLDREEPNYAQASQLGEEAIPHLIILIQGEDVGLATKAASLAGIINTDQSATALEVAVRHPNPLIRIAAAASAQNLTTIPSSLALELLDDSDVGVRKWTLKSLKIRHPAGVRERVEEIIRSDLDAGIRDRARQIIDQLP